MSSKFEHLEDLITHLRNGDEKAYVYLINAHHKLLFTYTMSLTNDRDQAQDIIQDVFLDIWKDRKKLNVKRSLKNYMYKIAYHKFINQYHKHRAISILERAYMDALDETFDDSNTELLERKIALIVEGINDLPKKCKEAFLLSKKEGLTNIEIAEYLNISTKTVEGHISKAYYLLREGVGKKIKLLLFLLFGDRKLSKSV
ncbi:sigma-70 family RNA polymerase sigma factor [Flavivirga amylovorans]|uniref:Sigma-70 family RNA polymerase sigma factor n=1 Tax=Flavivirga amylovorans TaxID=870486 RepID=A0ABT8X1R7_9FLAO|nr:sigma-70 family RNA polymerase sigma factor [Flavivirga amylovorans]MDO5987520.1 sigma-70 family RNA polymerase sigma factor [Flavivirga amylovorans]